MSRVSQEAAALGIPAVLLFGIPVSFLTWDGLKHLAMPAINLALFKLSLLVRLTRASTREAVLQDYVKFARAKGLGPGRVIGLRYKRDGALHDVRARKAVILAAGGFTINEAMLQQHCPALADARASGNRSVEGRALHSLGDHLFTTAAYERLGEIMTFKPGLGTQIMGSDRDEALHALADSDFVVMTSPSFRMHLYPFDDVIQAYWMEAMAWVRANLILISSWHTIRTWYPLAPDYMEVDAWANMPRNESQELRQKRMENFISFLGPAGFGTPDDVYALEGCQRGFAAWRELSWSDISRGMGKAQPSSQDELQMRAFWRRWHALMQGQRGPTECSDRAEQRAAAE